EISPRAERHHLIDVEAGVVEGRLRVSWHHGRRHRPETVARLAEAYVEELRALVAHCVADDAGGCTPSDLPLSGLSQEQIDRLLGGGRDVEDAFPLTPAQAGMLFHTRLHPGDGVYLEQHRWGLEGEVL